LCDRGTLDGLAYWPGEGADLLREVGTTLEAELARYAMVIHLCTPSETGGYNYQNPLRTETALEAAAIDARIAEIWSAHSRVMVVKNQRAFDDKLREVVEIIRGEIAFRQSVYAPAVKQERHAD
jgi:hypothetical protein